MDADSQERVERGEREGQGWRAKVRKLGSEEEKQKQWGGRWRKEEGGSREWGSG